MSDTTLQFLAHTHAAVSIGLVLLGSHILMITKGTSFHIKLGWFYSSLSLVSIFTGFALNFFLLKTPFEFGMSVISLYYTISWIQIITTKRLYTPVYAVFSVLIWIILIDANLSPPEFENWPLLIFSILFFIHSLRDLFLLKHFSAKQIHFEKVIDSFAVTLFAFYTRVLPDKIPDFMIDLWWPLCKLVFIGIFIRKYFETIISNKFQLAYTAIYTLFVLFFISMGLFKENSEVYKTLVNRIYGPSALTIFYSCALAIFIDFLIVKFWQANWRRQQPEKPHQN